MSMIDKFCGKLGLMDEVEEKDEVAVRDSSRKTNVEELKEFKPKKNPVPPDNVVNLHTASVNMAAAKSMKVMVVEPLSFDDAQCVADHLKNKKPVVVNFENTDSDIAKRIIDFISGTTYALSGNIQKVGNHIFLCAPSNVDVSFTPTAEDLTDKVVMPWLKK